MERTPGQSPTFQLLSGKQRVERFGAPAKPLLWSLTTTASGRCHLVSLEADKLLPRQTVITETAVNVGH